MSDVVGFADLPPGLYQIASPDEIRTEPVTVSLREADHYWVESRREQRGGQWVTVAKALHVNTTGLLLQAEAMGAHAHSRVVEIDRSRVRVVASGYWLRRDGTLEVVERSKEYDMAAETMKAALKEVRSRQNEPSGEQTAALVKVATEEAALALVGTLPDAVKARVMEARLEVQSHREALCRTKAENQVLRYFIQRCGGVLKRPPGQGDVEVALPRHMLIRKLDSAQVRSAVDSVYGPPAPPPSEPEPEEPVIENGQILGEEAADAAETEAVASDGEGDPWDDGASPEGEQVPEEPQGAKPEPAQVRCDDCGSPLPDNVVAYCQSPRGRQAFGGANLCYRCQDKRRGRAGKGGAR